MDTAMTFPKARLVVSAMLFISWLGFLSFLVLETKKVIIARPQFQIAQAVFVVKIRDDGGKPDPLVTVREILWGNGASVGQELRLNDLLGCKKEHGYSGAGDYVIPLTRRADAWQIVPISTPGYKRQNRSHGTLEIFDAGPHSDCVLDCFLEYAGEKPREAEELLKPLRPALAARCLGRDFFGADFGILPSFPVFLRPDFAWQDVVDLPRGPMPRQPIADAFDLQKRLKKCGMTVEVNVEELRIYPWTPEVSEQVLKCKP
jgi:hypothetical protein